MWSFAVLRHHPGEELLEAASLQVLVRIHEFNAQVDGCLMSYRLLPIYSCPGHDQHVPGHALTNTSISQGTLHEDSRTMAGLQDFRNCEFVNHGSKLTPLRPPICPSYNAHHDRVARCHSANLYILVWHWFTHKHQHSKHTTHIHLHPSAHSESLQPFSCKSRYICKTRYYRVILRSMIRL